MVRRYRRANALLALALFAVAGAMRWAPAYCCSIDVDASQTEIGCLGCCQSAPPPTHSPRPDTAPSCSGMGACPELCCSFRPIDQDMAPATRVSAQRITAVPMAFLPPTWLTVAPAPSVRSNNVSPPFRISPSPFYLQFQSFLC